MPIQQIAYDIPNDIAIEIFRGAYKRFGGIVRDSKTGVIVKHLKEMELPEKGGSAILQAVKQHPVVAIGIGAATAAGSAVTVYAVKKKKNSIKPMLLSVSLNLKSH